MMVPANRLLWLVALVLVPAFTLVGFGGLVGRLGLVLAAATLGLVMLDAVLSLDRLRSLRVRVDSPVQAIVGRPFEFELSLVWDEPGTRVLTLEFEVPSSMDPITMPREISVQPSSVEPNPNPSETSVKPSPIPSANGGRGEPTRAASDHTTPRATRVKGASRTLERGRHALPALHAQTNSRLGFWWMRRQLDLDGCVQAYPDLFHDRRLLAAQRIDGSAGAIASLAAGHGRSFERLREYVPGDELDDVHWRATAKRRRLITKLYQIERDQRIYVAIDQSRLSARASPRERPAETDAVSLLERYISAALVLGGVAQAQGDQFGLLGFSDSVDCYIPAGSGPSHFRACREATLELHVRRVNADYRELFSFFGNRVGRRSMLIVLTSTDDPALCEELLDCSRLVANRHLVVTAAVTPADARPLSDPEPIGDPSEIAERLASHLVWNRQRKTARQLGQNGIQFLALEHGTIASRVVDTYARVKRGQRL